LQKRIANIALGVFCFVNGIISVTMFSRSQPYGPTHLLLGTGCILVGIIVVAVEAAKFLVPPVMINCPECGTVTRHYEAKVNYSGRKIKENIISRVQECQDCGYRITVPRSGGSSFEISSKSETKLESLPARTKSKSGLRGSFPLDEGTINEEVGYGSPGVYALGYMKGKTFIIQGIGRSDTDVHARLKEYIGEYDRFKFAYSDSPQAAFTKECQLYHTFGGPEGKLNNKNHPERPQGSTWHCPQCNVFDSQVSIVRH
jgi:hypothetical protein